CSLFGAMFGRSVAAKVGEAVGRCVEVGVAVISFALSPGVSTSPIVFCIILLPVLKSRRTIDAPVGDFIGDFDLALPLRFRLAPFRSGILRIDGQDILEYSDGLLPAPAVH